MDTLIQRIKNIALSHGYDLVPQNSSVIFAKRGNRRLGFLKDDFTSYIRLIYQHNIGVEETFNFVINENSSNEDIENSICHEPMQFLTLDSLDDLIDTVILWTAYGENNEVILTGQDYLTKVYPNERYPLATVATGEGNLKYARADYAPVWGKNKGVLSYEDPGTYIKYRIDPN